MSEASGSLGEYLPLGWQSRLREMKPTQIYGSIGGALLLLIVVWNVLTLGAPDAPVVGRPVDVSAKYRPAPPPGKYMGGEAPKAWVPEGPAAAPPPAPAPEPAAPPQPTHCPFGNIDIHINVGPTSAEVAMYHLAMASLDEHLPCIGVIHIMFTRPKADADGKVGEFPPYNIGLPRRHAYKVWLFEDSFFPEFRWDAKWKHQYSRFTADLYVRPEAEFILFLDSDTLLAFPATCRSIFTDEGKPIWFYLENSFEWGPGAQAAIGLPSGDSPNVFGVKAYPPLAPKDMLPKLRKAMYDWHKMPYNAPFSAVFVAGMNMRDSMSEFNAMGQFMFNTTPEVFAPQRCPLQTDLPKFPENKDLMCSWFPTAFLHFPYPLTAFRDNSPENYRNWDYFVASRHWSLGKFHEDGARYTKRAQEAVQWGTCWRKRWKVTKEGDKVKAIKLAKPEREVPALEPVENWTEEDKARANRNPNVTRLTEPLTANGHVVDAELVEDAYCFSHDKFLIPPPDCFHYTEGKEGVRYDGEKIATYMLEEVVTPWPGYCSDGKFGRKPAGPLDEEGIER